MAVPSLAGTLPDVLPCSLSFGFARACGVLDGVGPLPLQATLRSSSPEHAISSVSMGSDGWRICSKESLLAALISGIRAFDGEHCHHDCLLCRPFCSPWRHTNHTEFSTMSNMCSISPLGGFGTLLTRLRLACADAGAERWTRRLHATNRLSVVLRICWPRGRSSVRSVPALQPTRSSSAPAANFQ